MFFNGEIQSLFVFCCGRANICLFTMYSEKACFLTSLGMKSGSFSRFIMGKWACLLLSRGKEGCLQLSRGKVGLFTALNREWFPVFLEKNYFPALKRNVIVYCLGDES
jgi:hypothetical protein